MKQHTIRSVSALAAVMLSALALIPLAGARIDRQATAKSTTVQVKGGEFFFRLSTKTAAKPSKVTFVFKNVGHVLHDFKVCSAPSKGAVNSCSGKKTALIQPGKTAKLVVTFKKKGKYPYLCTVPGHAQAGMKGVVTVK